MFMSPRPLWNPKTRERARLASGPWFRHFDQATWVCDVLVEGLHKASRIGAGQDAMIASQSK